MSSRVNPARGMRDFLPAVKARRERALTKIREVYTSHGFQEIETPVVEDYERLHAGLGGDNEKLSFSILQRGIKPEQLAAAAAEGNAEALCDLGLRFDLTVPLSRFYATNRAQLPPVFRAIQIAPVWRAERPQKGRYRQFVQADIDIIGEPGLLAEIELLTATSQVLSALGLRDCTIRVNDRRILFGLLTHCGFAAEVQERALITVDKLDKIGAAGVVAELAETDESAAQKLGVVLSGVESQLVSGIPLTATAIAAVLGEAAATADAAAGVASLGSLGEAVAGVLPADVRVVFDPTLVRGMGYYTGTIFEIAHPASGSSVGGGGRYDGMIGRFLGEQVPAAGFSIGFERIVDLIDFQAAGDARQLALVFEKDADFARIARIKAEAVAAGFTVRLEKRSKNMKALLSRLAGEGFTLFATVGADTAEFSALELRELAA